MRPRHIAVEGPMGSGKTLLATRLAALIGAQAVLEPPGGNPFLEEALKDRTRFAFQAQVFFALSRHQTLESVRQGDLFSGGTVTDFMLERERIFASLMLGAQELALYERIYLVVRDRLPPPDLVIYLQTRPDVLHDRLKKRDGRAKVALKDLEDLTGAYQDFFSHYDATPLLIVDVSKVDVANREEDVQSLAREALRPRPGVRHYNPR